MKTTSNKRKGFEGHKKAAVMPNSVTFKILVTVSVIASLFYILFLIGAKTQFTSIIFVANALVTALRVLAVGFVMSKIKQEKGSVDLNILFRSAYVENEPAFVVIFFPDEKNFVLRNISTKLFLRWKTKNDIRIFPLQLEVKHISIMFLESSLVHNISEKSPFFLIGENTLGKHDLELAILIEGTVYDTGQRVRFEKSFSQEEFYSYTLLSRYSHNDISALDPELISKN